MTRRITKSEISSTSKYLQVKEMDSSAGKRSAAKLISPAVKNASKFATIMDDWETLISQSYISESQEKLILNKKSKDDADCETSIHEMDNVTFPLPHEATKNDQVEADKLLQINTNNQIFVTWLHPRIAFHKNSLHVSKVSSQNTTRFSKISRVKAHHRMNKDFTRTLSTC
ncbi:CLUMA_CG006192, isoform A [Clunio marinus]|uniref:CLUMA_CG006192, isoform A n=1 Tax=Clunio marinus TaxID=568069 RepID=A0A1J1HZ69_9DIPT|nr:CLUMA_CG006192, isoform A [Clunio marinus]